MSSKDVNLKKAEQNRTDKAAGYKTLNCLSKRIQACWFPLLCIQGCSDVSVLLHVLMEGRKPNFVDSRLIMFHDGLTLVASLSVQVVSTSI